jgi:selenide,water dikinase
VIYPEKIPVIPGTEEFAAMGLIPGGAYKNREFRESMIRFSDRTGRELQDILFDPQTSGGLLFGVPEAEAESILARLKENQMASASIVGYITADHQGTIRV